MRPAVCRAAAGVVHNYGRGPSGTRVSICDLRTSRESSSRGAHAEYVEPSRPGSLFAAPHRRNLISRRPAHSAKQVRNPSGSNARRPVTGVQYV